MACHERGPWRRSLSRPERERELMLDMTNHLRRLARLRAGAGCSLVLALTACSGTDDDSAAFGGSTATSAGAPSGGNLGSAGAFNAGGNRPVLPFVIIWVYWRTRGLQPQDFGQCGKTFIGAIWIGWQAEV